MKEILREEKITLIQFIGSTGGLLGLFLGFSVVSLIEIFYMIFLWFANKVTQHSSSVNMDKYESHNKNGKNIKRTHAKVSSYLESIMNSKDFIHVKPRKGIRVGAVGSDAPTKYLDLQHKSSP